MDNFILLNLMDRRKRIGIIRQEIRVGGNRGGGTRYTHSMELFKIVYQ